MQRTQERRETEREAGERAGLGQTVDYRLACLQLGVFASRSIKIGT